MELNISYHTQDENEVDALWFLRVLAQTIGVKENKKKYYSGQIYTKY